MKLDYFELIEPYVNDNMEMLERLEFEEEITNNPELKKAVEKFPVVKEALEALIQEDARQALKRAKLELNDDFSIGKFYDQLKYNKLIKYPLAAILILALSGYPLWRTMTQKSDIELFATYYYAYPNLEGPNRSSADLETNAREKYLAYSAYNYEDYRSFINILNEVSKSTDLSSIDKFYLGIAQMETGNWETARMLLDEIAENNSKYSVEARWYLGLVYLRMEECEKAKSIFKFIQNSGLENHQKAKKIINKIQCKE